MCTYVFKKISKWEQFLLNEIKFWLIPRYISWSLTTKGAPQERSRGHPAALGVPHSPQQPCRDGHWAFWAVGTKVIATWLNTLALALKRWSSACWRSPLVWKWIARVTVIVKHMVFLRYGSFHFFSLCCRAQCLQQSMISGRCMKLFEYGNAEYLVFDTKRFFKFVLILWLVSKWKEMFFSDHPGKVGK